MEIVDCEFINKTWFKYPLYTCIVPPASIKITESGTAIGTIKGNHTSKYRHLYLKYRYVQGIIFFDATIKYFPRMGVTYFSRKDDYLINSLTARLTHLSLSNCGLIEISRNDLVGLGNLEWLSLSNNNIESLPDDLFTAMAKLSHIDFRGNRIAFASSKLLEPIKSKLTFADFRNNAKIDHLFVDQRMIRHYRDKFSSNRLINSLDVLMTVIDTNCQRPAAQLPAAAEKRRETQELGVYSAEDPNEEDFSASFLKKFADLWKSGKLCDFTFLVGEKQFTVHKTVLAIHSSVLSKAIEEKVKANESAQLKIEGFGAEEVGEFLEYLYTGKAPSTANAIQVFKLANFCEVSALRKICETIIAANVNEANAIEVLKLAPKAQDRGKMKMKAFGVIKAMFPNKKLDDKLIDNIEKLTKMVKTKQDLDSLFDD